MIRFLFGVILGLVVGAGALAAVAVVFPTEDGPIATRRVAGPATVATASVTPPPATTPAPAATPAPATATAPATDQGQSQVATATPAPATVPAPSGGAGGPSLSASPGGFSSGASDAPAAGPGLSLGSPNIDASPNPGIGTGGDSAPVRTAAAPQVAAANPNVTSGPSVDTSSLDAPEVGSEAGGASASGLTEGNALQQYAVPFDGADGKPLMALVLIDDGASPSLRPSLTALGAPVTVGVAGDLPDAQLVAAQHRENGFEIAAVAASAGPLGLQAGQGERSVSGSLAVLFRNVPAATTLVDAVGGAVPADEALTQSVLNALATTGHGLLTFAGDTPNNVPVAAEAAGVPSAVVYRVIDDQPRLGEITQQLAAAVDDAQRGGSVIVVGRLRPITIGAVQSWLLGNGADSVALAPVSALLN